MATERRRSKHGPPGLAPEARMGGATARVDAKAVKPSAFGVLASDGCALVADNIWRGKLDYRLAKRGLSRYTAAFPATFAWERIRIVARSVCGLSHVPMRCPVNWLFRLAPC